MWATSCVGSSWCGIRKGHTYNTLHLLIIGSTTIQSMCSPLTRQKLVHHLCEAISQLGMNTAGYSGHSFRIGAASTAAAVGFSDSIIQLLGRWKSSAFLAYIRSSEAQLAAVSTIIFI